MIREIDVYENKGHQEFIAICFQCGESVFFEKQNYNYEKFVSDIKLEGWDVRNEYCCYCPRCHLKSKDFVISDKRFPPNKIGSFLKLSIMLSKEQTRKIINKENVFIDSDGFEVLIKNIDLDQ